MEKSLEKKIVQLFLINKNESRFLSLSWFVVSELFNWENEIANSPNLCGIVNCADLCVIYFTCPACGLIRIVRRQRLFMNSSLLHYSSRCRRSLRKPRFQIANLSSLTFGRPDQMCSTKSKRSIQLNWKQQLNWI